MIDVALNQIIVTPLVPDVSLALRTDLYDIESTNTSEAKIQSVCTTTGNEHTVEKFSTESTIATKVPQGELALVLSTPTNEREQLALIGAIALIQLKGALMDN